MGEKSIFVTPNLVIVHAGKAHLDDALVVGLARALWPEILVERRDPASEELEDPYVLVADVGGLYEPVNNNFDHHQADLPAAVVLVTEHYLGQEFLDWVEESKPAWLSHSWLQQVSIRDTKGPRAAQEAGVEDSAGILTGTVLRGFERLEPWALELLRQFWVEKLEQFQKSQIEVREEDIPIWDLTGDRPVRLADLTSVPEGFNPNEWSRLVERRLNWADHDPALIVLRNDRGSGLKIIRRNDAPGIDLSVLVNHEACGFAHKNGFVAVLEVESIKQVIEILIEAGVVQ